MALASGGNMFDRSDAPAISERTTISVVLSTSGQITLPHKRLWRKFRGIEGLCLSRSDKIPNAPVMDQTKQCYPLISMHQGRARGATNMYLVQSGGSLGTHQEGCCRYAQVSQP